MNNQAHDTLKRPALIEGGYPIPGEAEAWHEENKNRLRKLLMETGLLDKEEPLGWEKAKL